ncbi:MAG TPA: DUF3455 domain-containing protein [Bryobacteraceae bacterium]|nr:DUF3455 domain-containing protein [Bryobacteraceae bacterium]
MRNLFFGLAMCVGVATAQQLPDLPLNLRVPENQPFLMMAHGKGTQIYTCRAGGSDGGPAWSLKAPDATLFNVRGQAVAKHFAGPTWEATDGSSVKGKVVTTAPAPNPDAIPWLLLSAASHAGNGIMSKVENIQRVKTVGGKAPATGCDASHIGAEASVPYEADYYFYLAAAGH